MTDIEEIAHLHKQIAKAKQENELLKEKIKILEKNMCDALEAMSEARDCVAPGHRVHWILTKAFWILTKALTLK